ncbi:MAG: AI-2E family transporter [Thermoanaerobacteraceae bacterium]
MVNLQKKYLIYGLYIILSLFFAYTIRNYWNNIKEILTPFIVSGLLAYVLSPFVKYFKSKGLSLNISIFIVLFIIFVFIIIILVYIIPLLLSEVLNLFKILPFYINELDFFLKKIKLEYLSYLPPQIEDILNKNIYKLNKLLSLKFDEIFASTLSFSKNIFDLFLIPIITFYILKDKKMFESEIFIILSEKNKQKIIIILKDINLILSKYIRGQLYISFFVGVFTTLGFLIIKVKYALLIGIFAGVLNIIPYLGPIIGIIPAVLLGMIDSVYKGFLAFIVFITVQQIENAFVTPKIISDSVGLHPLTIILSLIAGEEFFGLWGLLLAVPIVASIKIILKDLFIDI